MDPIQIYFAAEGERRQDRQLVRGVDTVDIESGIRLGIAQFLCLLEDRAEVPPGFTHRRQDVVAGAVEDPIDPVDAVSGQAFSQALYHRNTAGNRGLVRKAGATGLGTPGERGAVVGKQGLVGGDDMATAIERRFDQRLGRPVGAADQFDHDVHALARSHGHRIVEPGDVRQVDPTVLQPVAG